MFGNEGKIHITFPRTHHPHGLMSLVYTKTLPLSGSKKIVSILPNILPCVKLIRMLFQWLWQKNMMMIKVGQLNGRQIRCKVILLKTYFLITLNFLRKILVLSIFTLQLPSGMDEKVH